MHRQARGSRGRGLAAIAVAVILGAGVATCGDGDDGVTTAEPGMMQNADTSHDGLTITQREQLVRWSHQLLHGRCLNHLDPQELKRLKRNMHRRMLDHWGEGPRHLPSMMRKTWRPLVGHQACRPAD